MQPAEVSIGAYGFVGFCLLFGFVSAVAGGYQAFTGRRSEKLVLIILVMGAIFVAVGMIVRGLG